VSHACDSILFGSVSKMLVFEMVALIALAAWADAAFSADTIQVEKSV
jgi:hypothetical protein